MREILALLVVLLLGACARSSLVEPPIVGRLDSVVALRPGQRASIEGTPLELRFLGVPEDSRCPVDVTCVWEGDALVQLAVLGAAPGERRIDLHTSLQPRSEVVGGFRVSLEGVEPFPRSGTEIPRESYVVEIRVSRAP